MSRRLVPTVVVIAAVLLIGACSSDASTKDTISVTSSDSECIVARTELVAGSSTFTVKNDGGDVTEVYVYGDRDEIQGEVENIGPGTSRDLTVDLTAGTYEVACKPGQKGDGIRTEITVTGSGGTATPKPTESVEVSATDYSFDGLDGAEFEPGATVEIRMSNDAPGEEHELEVFAPNGDVLGEVGPTKPGATGRVVLTFDEPGEYRIVCGIDDHEAQGMVGTFTVA